MLRKILLSLAVGLPLALAGCGGGGSSGDGAGSGASSPSGTAVAQEVPGPLDPLQQQLGDNVFNQLAGATAGTPLAGTINAANEAVNGNLLNTLDALINGLQNPAYLQTTTPAQVQQQLKELVANLQGLITSLAPQGAGGAGGGNPLAGTPLEALGALLPQLQGLLGQLSGGQQSLPSLGALFAQLQSALNSAISQLPANVQSAPILGGLLSVLPPALGNIGNVINTLQTNPQDAPAAVSSTLQNLITGITTKVLPLTDLYQLGGLAGGSAPGMPLAQIQNAIQSLVSKLQAALTGGGNPAGALDPTQLSALLTPVQGLVQKLLPGLPGLGGTGSGSSDPVQGLLNSLLNLHTLLGQLAAAGGGSTSAGPLDQLQAALHQSVFVPLEQAANGTPLSGTLICADDAVNGNLLNTVDALLVGLQNPATLQTLTAAQVQAQLAGLVSNLESLLSSLASSGGCAGAGSTAGGSNPLAGTPLAPLGDALGPVLLQVQTLLASGPQGLPALGAAFTQIQTALQSALSSLPASATGAPVLGGLLTSLPTMLGDISNLLNAVQGPPTLVPAAFATALQDILTNITTKIAPLASLQQLAGQTGANNPLSQVTAAIQQIVSQIETSLGAGSLVTGPTQTQLGALLTPVRDLLTQQLIPKLQTVLAGLTAGAPSNPVTGLLNTLLPTLQQVLNGVLGGNTSCALSTVPLLSIVCGLL